MTTAFTKSLRSTFAETMTPDAFQGWLPTSEWDWLTVRNIVRLTKNANFAVGQLCNEYASFRVFSGGKWDIRF